MEDLFNLPNIDQNIQIFTSDNTNWQIWSKPRNAKFVFILTIGGGGGGAAGTSGALGTNRAGGGGGAASNVAKFFIPAPFVPDVLYVSVGKGGNGGTSLSVNGVDGGISYVGISPNTGSTSVLIQSSNAGASGGIGQVGGSQATATLRTTISNTLGISTIIPTSVPYIAGSNGSASGVGNNKNPLAIVSGGAGGAGTNTSNTSFNGGNVALTTWSPQISSGLGGVSGSNGSPGYQGYLIGANNSESKPLFFTGGAGGGSFGSGTGWAGGNGAIGCGGGGGGAGVTGGPGGKGGDGIVYIISY